jgi:osmoprotectant transport system ATP-binding protein
VGVARAFACEPALLLMDEPFGALDPITRLGLQREFQALQRRLGIAVVLVTHDVAEALRLGDHVAVMNRGRVVQAGLPAEIRSRPEPSFVRPFLEAAGLA